ncbi:LD-carboxypeptidase [Candidatus Saccharibacteria bacterium oral taxon 488]|nr:LD-carboxypeptidase [Candidatus Saccharibacteria bacterium oral taxon 488]
MIPDKLKPGDEVRVVAPARSASDIDERVLDRAKAALESLGLKVTFSKNAFSQSQRGCPTDDEKVEDLQEAFMDENVRCILAAIGGFNSNQMLGKINWQIIKDNPKIFGGFSDITVLNHAILAKTGLVTYTMPNFYCFGLPPENSYSLEYFQRCLFADQPAELVVQQSETFYDFPWNYDEVSPRQALENDGPRVVQSGSAEGVMIGGNLCSLNLLNGTEYFPKVEGDVILCIEDDSYDSITETFERHVQALMQQPFFRQVKAILVGRFQGESRATDDMISDIILSKNIDSKIPVIVNLDFGHTDPKFTYPVGGKCEVVAEGDTKIVIRCDD